MFFIIRFIIAWLVWFMFADKRRMKELVPVAIFAAFIGSTSDLIVLHIFKLWAYHDSSFLLSYLSDDWGIYFVTAYLFMQWLPKNRTLTNMLIYWFAWTTFALVIEWFHLFQGVMTHHNGWSLGWSYVTGWLLFYIQYKFYCFTSDRSERTHDHNSTNKIDFMNPTILTIIESSSHPIISIDRFNKVIIWNTSAEEVFGWKKSEVLNQLLPTIPKKAEHIFKERAKTKLNGQVLHDVTITLQTKNGDLLDVCYDAFPTYNQDKEITGSIAIFKEYCMLSDKQAKNV